MRNQNTTSIKSSAQKVVFVFTPKVGGGGQGILLARPIAVPPVSRRVSFKMGCKAKKSWENFRNFLLLFIPNMFQYLQKSLCHIRTRLSGYDIGWLTENAVVRYKWRRYEWHGSKIKFIVGTEFSAFK